MSENNYRYQNKIEGYKIENNLQSSYISAKEGITKKEYQQILTDIYKIIDQYRRNEKLQLNDKSKGVLIGIGQYLYTCLRKEFEDIFEKNSPNLENLNKLIKHNVQNEFNKVVEKTVNEQVEKSVQNIISTSTPRTISFDDDKLTTDEKLYIENLLENSDFQKEYINIYNKLYTATKNSLKTFKMNFSGRQDLVKQIANLMLQLDEKFDSDIALIEEEYKNKNTENAKRLIIKLKDDIQKDVEDHLRKNYDKNNAIGMRLKDAFIKTLQNNSKFYTKNQNYVAKVVASSARNAIKNIKRSFKKIQIATYKILHPIKTLKRWFRWWKLINLSGRLLKNSLHFLQGAMNIGIKLTIGLTRGVTRLAKGIFNFTKKIIGFTVNFVKITVGKITSGIKGLFNFIKNNTFLKRMYKFLKTDAGAMFLGSVAAFIKVFVIDNLIQKIISLLPELKFMKFNDIFGYDEFLSDVKEELFDSNFMGIATISKLFKNTLFMLIEVLRYGSGIFDKITSGKNLEKLKENFEKLISYAEFALNISKFIAKYRFTSLSLKTSKFIKHPYISIAGLAVGFLADTIVNGKITEAWKNKDDEKGHNGTNVFLKFGQNNVKDMSYMNKENTFVRINGLYSEIKDEKKRQQKRDYTSKKYFDLLDRIKDNEELTDELSETFEPFNRQSIKNVSSVQFDEWFNELSKINVYGKEIDIGNRDYFLSLGNEMMKLNYLKYLIKKRQDYVQNIKTSMYNSGQRNLDIETVLQTVEIENYNNLRRPEYTIYTQDLYYDNFIEGIRGYKIDRDYLLYEKWKTFDGIRSKHTGIIDKNAFKIARMQNAASIIIPRLGQYSEHEHQMQTMNLANEEINRLYSDSSRNDKVGEEARHVIERLNVENPERQLQEMQRYLMEKLKEKEKDSKGQYKAPEIRSDIIIAPREEIMSKFNEFIKEYAMENGNVTEMGWFLTKKTKYGE